MKKNAIILLSIIFLSCSDDTTYSIAPELSTYIDAFYTEAAERGKILPKDNLVAELKSNCQSIIVAESDGNQWYLYFDKEAFELMGNTNNRTEAYIFNQLGGIILKRDIVKSGSPEAFTIMNGYYKVNGYSNLDRPALLDELFK